MAEEDALLQPDLQEPNEPILELGDRVRLNKETPLTGTIVYRSYDSLFIRPDGVLDTSKEFKITEEGLIEGEDTLIDSVDLLNKRKKKSFIEIFNLQADQLIHTYEEDGTPYKVYTIKPPLNLEEDALTLIDPDTNEEIFIRFNFIGVERDLPFRNLFGREAPEKPVVSTTEEAPTSEVVEEDLEDIEDFTFLDDELEAPADQADVERLIEIPSAERIYPDITQKSEAYADLLSLQSTASQQLEETQKATRVLVELFFRLRASVLRLSSDGFPIGVKSTSLQTLADALETHMLALSRPVLDIKKILFVDEIGDGSTMENLQIEDFYSFIDKSIQYLENPSEMAGSKFIPFLTTYLNRFNSTWHETGSTPLYAFQRDEEAFRLKAPGDESSVPGYSSQLPDPKKVRITTDSVSEVELSMVRVLKAIRHKNKLLQPGEEAVITAYIMFPYLYSYCLSTLSQESLYADITAGLQPFTTLKDLLKQSGEITEIPSSKQPFRISVDGGTLGNIPLRDYLKALDLKAEGMGGFWPLQVLMGMREREWTLDQQAVLSESISATQALILDQILKQREALATMVSQPPSVQGIQMIPEASVLIDQLAGEPSGILLKIQNDLREHYPSYANSDVALVGLILRHYPDLAFAQMANQPIALTKARTAHLRNEYILQIQNEKQLKHRKEFAGVIPTPNRCAHVKNLLMIRKVKDEYKRMALLVKFLSVYQGEKEDNWVNCVGCSQHLLCVHELLQVYQFLRPGDVGVLNKEIQLNFGGGQFQGFYICRNCGQSIQEIEFDTHIEFDDSGRPMMGRSELVDKESLTEQQIEEVLGPIDSIDDAIEFDNETKRLIYTTAKQMADRLFTPLNRDAFILVVNRTYSIIQQIPSRERYLQIQKAQRKTTMADYDVYLNQALICAVGVHLLILIQSHVPDLIIRTIPTGCRNLGGQPLELEGGTQGIQCVISVISSFTKDSAPWNLTQFQKIQDDTERQKVISSIFEPILSSSLQDPTILHSLNKKREYRKKILGSAAGQGRPDETLPAEFKPIPYQQTPEEFVEKIIVPEAATIEDRVELWIRQGNTLAKQHKLPMPIVFSEASCCISPLYEMDEFWKKPETQQSLPEFKKRSGVPPPPKITKAEPIMKPAQLVRPLPDPPEESYYQLFLKVCNSSDSNDSHKGYSHEFGLTHKCIWCGLQLPMEPELLTAEMGRSEIEKQGIEITKETFEDLLNKTHLANSFKTPSLKEQPGPLDTWISLSKLKPEPVEKWSEVMAKTQAELMKLPPDAEEMEVAIALNDFSTLAQEVEMLCKMRLPKQQHALLDSIIEEGAESIIRFLQSYMIVPVRRFMSKTSSKSYKIPKSWGLDSFHKMDLDTILENHSSYLLKFNRIEISPWLHSKMQAMIDQSRVLLSKLQAIRPIQIPGKEKTYYFFLRFCLFAPLANFVDPNILPRLVQEGVEVPISQVEEQALFPARFLSDMIKRFMEEGFRLTPEQIREQIAKRAEMEKENIIKKINAKDRTGKDIEKMMMRLGIGEYAVGGTSAIYSYNKEQYAKEREQRAEFGMAPPTADALGYYGMEGEGEGYIGDEMLGEINGFDDE